jgi:hypothetical protein
MSDTLDTETETPQEESPDIKQLRKLAKQGEKAAELEAEATKLRQELAIVRSGIDADTPLGKLFLKGYDGDLTDVDSMKAAAQEVGVPFKEGSAPVVAEDTPAPNGTEERQVLAAESPADTGVQTNPVEEGIKRFYADQGRGDTWDTAAAKFLGSQAEAALAGDSRVIVE